MIFYLCACKQALGNDLRRQGCILWWCSAETCGCHCHAGAGIPAGGRPE